MLLFEFYFFVSCILWWNDYGDRFILTQFLSLGQKVNSGLNDFTGSNECLRIVVETMTFYFDSNYPLVLAKLLNLIFYAIIINYIFSNEHSLIWLGLCNNYQLHFFEWTFIDMTGLTDWQFNHFVVLTADGCNLMLSTSLCIRFAHLAIQELFNINGIKLVFSNQHVGDL